MINPKLPKRLKRVLLHASSPRDSGLPLDPSEFSVDRLNRGYYSHLRSKVQRQTAKRIAEAKERGIKHVVDLERFNQVLFAYMDCRDRGISPNPYKNAMYNALKWFNQHIEEYTKANFDHHYSHFVKVYRAEIDRRFSH